MPVKSIQVQSGTTMLQSRPNASDVLVDSADNLFKFIDPAGSIHSLTTADQTQTFTNKTLTAPTITAPTVTGAGTISLTGATVDGTSTLKADGTLTGAAYGVSAHFDQGYSKLTLTPATVVTAANGLNAYRGEVNITAGKTLGDGNASYVTGVYGRVNFNTATINIGSGDLAAVYGKFDMGSTSTLTSGHIAPVQANIVNPPSGAATAGVSLFYGESASGTPIGNGIELYMGAAYLMKLTQVSGGSFFTATAPTTLAKGLKINVGGTDYWIGLYSAGS